MASSMDRADSSQARKTGPTEREERVRPSGTLGEPSADPARAKAKAYEEREGMLEEVLGRENMLQALRRVERNRGAAGVDGMTVKEMRPYLKDHWPEIRRRLLSGTYEPEPVRRVENPKPSGGKRGLGIPTVIDRLIQQALLQVLTPVFDPGFSEHSYGFRPGRRGHDAIRRARQNIE